MTAAPLWLPWLAAAAAAAGAMIVEPRTGLGFDPPPGFSARIDEPLTSDAQMTASGPHERCRIVFARRPPDAGPLPAPAEWRARLQAQLGRMWPKVAVEPFEAEVPHGASAVAGTADKPEALFLYAFENARGRTTIFCLPSESRQQRETDQIARAVRLP